MVLPAFPLKYVLIAHTVVFCLNEISDLYAWIRCSLFSDIDSDSRIQIVFSDITLGAGGYESCFRGMSRIPGYAFVGFGIQMLSPKIQNMYAPGTSVFFTLSDVHHRSYQWYTRRRYPAVYVVSRLLI